MGTTIFFSYSHKDEEYRDRLEVHLSILKRSGQIETWHDRRMVAGDNLNPAIAAELEKADIILLLISADFLDSYYCYEVEMNRALQRHQAKEARVIPIILTHCDWRSTELKNILAAPIDGKPIVTWTHLDEAFQNVVLSIRDALPKEAQSNSSQRMSAEQQFEEHPRSSNLWIKKSFSDAEKDKFLYETFEFIAKFFGNSLDELKLRNPVIDFSFRNLDAERFTAVLYRNGDAISRCRIRLGGPSGHGIAYSRNDRATDNSYNESVSVRTDDHGLFLTTLGMVHFGSQGENKLTQEGAAEYFWAIFMEPLQRN